MADFLQGAALPDVTTTQTTATTTPQWYTDYMAQLPSQLNTAIDQGGAAGSSALQTEAYSRAPTAIDAGKGYLQNAADQYKNVTDTSTANLMQDYLNPYTKNVVDELGRLGQQQFRETLAPGAVAGAAGSGQFGSRRGMQVYGNVARDMNLGVLGKQNEALNLGWQNALKAAQDEKKLGLDTATGYNNLSTTAYNQGVGGLDALS
jgi:hypothetical protein